MKKRNYIETLCVKISKEQRSIIEGLANRDDLSIGEAARELLDLGIKARGVEC
jgi:hypothetical protein